MATKTAEQRKRSEAAKKGARTRARNQAKQSSTAKSGGSKSSGGSGEKRGTEAVASRLAKDAPITVVRKGFVPMGHDPTEGRGVPDPPNERYAGTDVAKLDDLPDVKFERVDGAQGVLRVGKHAWRVRQADLTRAQKQLAAGVQNTY